MTDWLQHGYEVDFLPPGYVKLKSRVICAKHGPTIQRHRSNPVVSEVLCEGLRCTDGKFDWRAWERHCFEAWICNDYA